MQLAFLSVRFTQCVNAHGSGNLMHKQNTNLWVKSGRAQSLRTQPCSEVDRRTSKGRPSFWNTFSPKEMAAGIHCQSGWASSTLVRELGDRELSSYKGKRPWGDEATKPKADRATLLLVSGWFRPHPAGLNQTLINSSSQSYPECLSMPRFSTPSSLGCAWPCLRGWV